MYRLNWFWNFWTEIFNLKFENVDFLGFLNFITWNDYYGCLGKISPLDIDIGLRHLKPIVNVNFLQLTQIWCNKVKNTEDYLEGTYIF